MPAFRQQLAMAADFGDAPAVEHDDAAGLFDRRQAVRDHQRRASLHQRLERRLHVALRFGIERRSRLVQYQHRRILEQRARDRQPLALAARQLDAVLAHQRIESLRHLADEFHRVRGFGRGDDVRLAGVAHHAVRDIGRDAVVEEHDVLAHQRDVGAQAGERQRLQIVAVEQYAPAGRAVKTRHQIGERALAAAGCADQRHGFIGIDGERDRIKRQRMPALPYEKLTLSKRISPRARAIVPSARGRSRRPDR